jgi:signal peptidase I
VEHLPTAGWIVAAVIVLLGTLMVLRRRVFTTRVSGSSMSPTYADGSVVLAVRSRRLRPGDIVVFQPPAAAVAYLDPADRATPMVKRVVSVAVGQVVVHGDNPAGLDSRAFGAVPLELVIGRAVRPLQRAAVAG